MTLAVCFSARGERKGNDPSRQRRLNRGGAHHSTVADATWRRIAGPLRALKHTAKIKGRYAAGRCPWQFRAKIWVMTSLTGRAIPSRPFGPLEFVVLKVPTCLALAGQI